MGRLASKRKIKQCDPFYKGKKSNGLSNDKYDLPPTISKKKKRRERKILNQSAIDRFVLGGDAVSMEVGYQPKKSKKALANVEGRREGESMRSFNQRMAAEVRKVIYHETKKEHKRCEKMKTFFKLKKEKAKLKNMTEQEKYELEYQKTGSTKRDNFAGAETIKFGDRVDAPPILPVLTGVFKKKVEALKKNKLR
jgi:hypothetical protein